MAVACNPIVSFALRKLRTKGKKVWLNVERDLDYPGIKPYRVKAVLTQPTSPPCFFARDEDPPVKILETGQWLSIHEAQQAVLYDAVVTKINGIDIN